jgi:hypothetical protein
MGSSDVDAIVVPPALAGRCIIERKRLSEGRKVWIP